MTFDAADFSRFETCPRLPQIYRTFEPPRWPIRQAVKIFLESGIRAAMGGENPEITRQEFIHTAANPGFLYPDGEAYTLAQDHASWLEGTLRLIQEEHSGLEMLPLFQVGKHTIHVEGWKDSQEIIHIFKVSTNFDTKVEWPELIASAFTENEVFVHVYRLPAPRASKKHPARLLSPLCMAYQHPTFVHVQYRLARLFDDPEFNQNWKRIGRWEIQPEVSWDEWRRGIDKDKCLDQIRQSHSLSPTLDYSRKQLLFDIEAMCEAQDRPSIYPRFREKCPTCVFHGLCHGDSASRAEYQVAGKEELARFEQAMAAKNNT